MSPQIKDLEQRVSRIENRNKRVELDKSWEISFSRKIIITILTYLVIVLFFTFANLPKPWINSIVPTVGFILSTLSLPYLKKIWVKIKKLI